MTAEISQISDREQLELIAQDIERLQTTAVLHIAAHAAKAHELFRYNRDEGGYAGWMKDRLGHSRSSAYRLLDVHKRFGGGESVPMLGTLPPSALYLLAAPATPPKAVDQVAARIEAGERMSCATVAEVIAKAKGIDTSAAVHSRERLPDMRSAVETENAPADTVILRDWKTGVGYVDADQPAGDDHHHHHHDHADAGEVGQPAAPPPIESEPAPTEPAPAAAEPAPDQSTIAAAAVNLLSHAELPSFLDQLSPAHKRAFEQKFGARNSDNTNAEIATLARECSALLTHPEQNTDAIRKKLARIKKLTGSDGQARTKAAKSNAQLDHGAFAHGMGLAG
jgi:hypothetical protein